VGAVVGIEFVFLRLCMGMMPGCTGNPVLGLVRRVRLCVGCVVVPGILLIAFPVLARFRRIEMAGSFFAMIVFRTDCHEQ
jgi:hypothetical protein